MTAASSMVQADATSEWRARHDSPALSDPSPTIAGPFLRRSAENPSGVAVYSRGQAVTYGALAEQVLRLSGPGSVLATLPVGSVVTCSVPDPAHVLALVYACARLRLIVCPLDEHLKRAERQRLIEAASPAVDVARDESFANLVRGDSSAVASKGPDQWEAPGDEPTAQCFQVNVAAPSRWREGQGVGGTTKSSCFPPARQLGSPGSFRREAASTGTEARHGPVSGEDLFYLGFTSGSTGRPRGVLRTQASWGLSFERMTGAFGLRASDCILVPGHLSHSLFLTAALHGLSLGARVVCAGRFSAARLSSLATRYQATALYVVPSMARALVAHLGDATLSVVRTVVIAGETWPQAERALLQGALPSARLLEYYGSSEMGFVSLSTPADRVARPESVGRPFEGVEVAIRDASGAPAPPGEEGAIFARGQLTYARGLDEPATVPPRGQVGEWVSAGDRGYLDEQGYLFLTGRGDQQINSGGLKVSPTEVEAPLRAHPRVRDALVVGVEDPRHGRVVGALVVAEPTGSPPVTERMLQAWLRPRLATYKLPRRWKLVAAIPRTLSGKPDLARARALLEAGRRGRASRGDEGASSEG